MKTQHLRKHSIVENTASSKTQHRRKHSIVENTASSKTQHRRKHSIAENTASPKTQHRRKNSIAENTASSKTQHRRKHRPTLTYRVIIHLKAHCIVENDSKDLETQKQSIAKNTAMQTSC